MEYTIKNTEKGRVLWICHLDMDVGIGLMLHGLYVFTQGGSLFEALDGIGQLADAHGTDAIVFQDVELLLVFLFGGLAAPEE